ncbi:MAG: hypothetical protein ABIH82_04665 [Candidatus Woesearchaeota archaeon]
MNKSIHQTVYDVFVDNPENVFTTVDLSNQLNVKKKIITIILYRLHNLHEISRTPVQLTNGFHYSYSNKNKLEELYYNYLLPYDFEDKNKLITEIKRKTFGRLKSNYDLKIDNDSKFIKKYPKINFNEPKIQEFLSMITGFSMCDGHIETGKVRFFFRRKSDSILFVNNFKKIFNREEFIIKKPNNGESYVAELRKSASASRLIQNLGTPKGNKVFQPFMIPNWIYYGPNEIKKKFLSTVIGNEGSAPSNNRWRIQFVLSKCKEHVPNLIEFLNQIRAMLYHFGITTSHIQLRKQQGRQFHGRFYIKGKENLHKFYNEFSFLYASEKQKVLEDLIKRNL